MENKPICKTEGCGNQVMARGVCNTCFSAINRAIQAGKITGWAQAVELGLCRESTRKRSPMGKRIKEALANADGN